MIKKHPARPPFLLVDALSFGSITAILLFDVFQHLLFSRCKHRIPYRIPQRLRGHTGKIKVITVDDFEKY